MANMSDLELDPGEIILQKISDQEQAYYQGCQQFDREDYVGAQTAFDAAQLQEFTADRLFYEGLKLTAAAFFEFQLHKINSSIALFAKAHDRLKKFRPSFARLNVDELSAHIENWQAYLRAVRQNPTESPAIPLKPQLKVRMLVKP